MWRDEIESEIFLEHIGLAIYHVHLKAKTLYNVQKTMGRITTPLFIKFAVNLSRD
jgi:hypothetical protein